MTQHREGLAADLVLAVAVVVAVAVALAVAVDQPLGEASKMYSVVPNVIARQPWRMLIPLIILTCFGGAVLYSAAGGHFGSFAKSHFIRFGVFLAIACMMTLFSRNFTKILAYPIYCVIVVLLLVVEVRGAMGGGAQRWLDLGFMRLQPSELMKPAIVLVLARFYDTLPSGLIGTWRSLVPAGALIALPMALVLLQPDLGTSLAIGFGGVVVMFLAGLPMRWFVMAGIAGAVAAPIAYYFGLKEYQQKRVLTFLDPESDPLGSGYHITQSKIAIGSGGFSGKGFNEGSQSHLNYLPEPHTDFVFSTMAEEWGFLGGMLVLILFGFILRWGLQVAADSKERFSQLLASGMTATIFFYVMINLMMVMGMAPVVGIPLPFMSHGGSSMMTNMLCIGTLMLVNKWNKSGGSGRIG